MKTFDWDITSFVLKLWGTDQLHRPILKKNPDIGFQRHRYKMIFLLHSVLSFGEQLAWGFPPKGMWKWRSVSHTANLIA